MSELLKKMRTHHGILLSSTLLLLHEFLQPVLKGLIFAGGCNCAGGALGLRGLGIAALSRGTACRGASFGRALLPLCCALDGEVYFQEAE